MKDLADLLLRSNEIIETQLRITHVAVTYNLRSFLKNRQYRADNLINKTNVSTRYGKPTIHLLRGPVS